MLKLEAALSSIHYKNSICIPGNTNIDYNHAYLVTVMIMQASGTRNRLIYNFYMMLRISVMLMMSFSKR